MKSTDVQIGEEYVVKVSGRMAVVKITAISPYGGWVGQNTKTHREVRIRTARRLRGRAIHLRKFIGQFKDYEGLHDQPCRCPRCQEPVDLGINGRPAVCPKCHREITA